jgi:ATP-dependent Clp protease ATP-binding subunit ClpA
MIGRVNKQLEEKAIRLELTAEAEELLLRKGYDSTYGARQLRRTIQKHIEDPLAEAIVSAQIHEGARIEVRANGESFVFVPVDEPSLNLAER